MPLLLAGLCLAVPLQSERAATSEPRVLAADAAVNAQSDVLETDSLSPTITIDFNAEDKLCIRLDGQGKVLLALQASIPSVYEDEDNPGEPCLKLRDRARPDEGASRMGRSLLDL
jgi:hypothetical protein